MGGFRSDGQPGALVVVESDAPFSKLLSKDPIFFDKVIDDALLAAPAPPRKRVHKEVQDHAVHRRQPTVTALPVWRAPGRA